MLQIPKVPTVTKGFHFENVAAHQLRQDLAVKIRECIMTLIAATYVPNWQGMFYKFIDCIEPGTVKDLARLPYQARGPNDTTGTQIGCVYARLSWIIQLYWVQCLDAVDNTRIIRQYIDDLRKWAIHGIANCRLEGDIRHGYWLSVPEK